MDTFGASRGRHLGSITQSNTRSVASVLVTDGVTCFERCLVADLLYALLLIGVFVVLALTLRGLEKL